MPEIEANKYVLKIDPYKPGKPIEELQRELGLKNVIKLASNENSFGASSLAIEAIKSAVKSVNRYPDGSCFYLRRELSQHLNVKAEDIIFGNGSDEIIILALRAFLRPGKEIVVCDPSFLMYGIYSASCGAKIIKVALKDFEYDLDAVKEKITQKTKFVFLASPNNPTGAYIGESQLKGFLGSVPDNLIVFLDEAYFEFVDAADYPDTLELLKNYKNIILTRTFSKAYGLAGLRIGYGLADSYLIDCMNRVRDPFNVNYLAQVAARAALKDKVFLRQVKKLVIEGKNYLYKQLERLDLNFVESQANFILIDLGRPSKKIVDNLLAQGIIVRDMKAWGLPNFIRVTVGRPQENVRFINALIKFLKK